MISRNGFKLYGFVMGNRLHKPIWALSPIWLIFVILYDRRRGTQKTSEKKNSFATIKEPFCWKVLALSFECEAGLCGGQRRLWQTFERTSDRSCWSSTLTQKEAIIKNEVVPCNVSSKAKLAFEVFYLSAFQKKIVFLDKFFSNVKKRLFAKLSFIVKVL